MSLSCIDLAVGLVVMPFMTVVDVIYFSDWTYGAVVCDIWYLFTAVCTSSSVLHLLMIAIDRYLSITRIGYSLDNNYRNIVYMICFAWIFAFMVSMAPILGWRDYEKFIRRIENKICYASLNIAYEAMSAILLFVGPVAVMIPLYYSIYKVFRNTNDFIPGNYSFSQYI